MIVRDGAVLLSRLAPSVSAVEIWTLPGGGIDFGEHPDAAVVREVHEETGLDCVLGSPIWIGSAHRVVDRESDPAAMHSVRIVYDAWVAPDAPEPRVVEVDGSTMDARWVPLADVESGAVPTVPMVPEALTHYRPARKQRLAAYALVPRGGQLLLTRNSALGPRPGVWSLPGGGLEHGEPPAAAAAREVAEETGLVAAIGELLGVHDEHFTGTAPHGRVEDFHGVHLVYAATIEEGGVYVRDGGGTTDAVGWFEVSELLSGAVEVSALVTAALGMRAGQ